ncbi:hypothetical protein ACTAQI_13865 [Pseudarthrobacter sp. alpha12b]
MIKLPLWLSLSVLTVLGIGTASIAAKGFDLTIVLAHVVLEALVLVGIALAKVTRKISAIVFITTIGAYISSLWFFGAEALNAAVKTADFLSSATVMLPLPGLSLGKDIPLLKNFGWKIIPVGSWPLRLHSCCPRSLPSSRWGCGAELVCGWFLGRLCGGLGGADDGGWALDVVRFRFRQGWGSIPPSAIRLGLRAT